MAPSADSAGSSRTPGRLSPLLKQSSGVTAVRGEGAYLYDKAGNAYLDFTSGIGVTSTGHCHPKVVEAIREQAESLTHGMGDVHPPAVKVDLLERLSDLSMMDRGRAALTTTGAEAVEVALKTARLHTGKPGVISFSGAYHGLTYGVPATTAASPPAAGAWAGASP